MAHTAPLTPPHLHCCLSTIGHKALPSVNSSVCSMRRPTPPKLVSLTTSVTPSMAKSLEIDGYEAVRHL